MPYAIKPNLLDDKNKDSSNQSGVNISGGAGADFSTGVPGQESTSAAKNQKSSGNYANIQSYLDANRDQGDQMGQQISSNVESKAQDAQSKISGLQAKAPEVKDYDPNATFSKLGSLSDQEKSDYRNTRATGGYSGPQSIDKVDGYADAQKAAIEASGLVKNTANEYGQQALLKDAYKRPDYSAGQNKLDQVLLQGSAGSKQALEGISKKYAGLDNLFNTTAGQVGESINKANQTALANKNKIVQAEADQWKGLVDPIQARADEANRLNPELISRIQSDAADETLSQETLDQLGLGEGQNIYDLNLGNYITPDATAVGLNNVANAEERTKYQQLADLFQDQTRTQITGDGKSVKPVSFNKDQYEKDLAGKSAQYQDYANNKTGDFAQFIAESRANGSFIPRNYVGDELAIGGSFWDPLNQGSLNYLINNKDQLMQDKRGSGAFSDAFMQALPKFIDWKQNKMSGNRKIKKG